MKTNNVDDYQLVEEAINGNKRSIETLIERHKNKVYTYILLIVKKEQLAEDIFQETFIKVIKSLRKGKYQEKGIFASWVIRIAHNLIIDYFRKAKHLRLLSSEDTEVNIFNSSRFSDTNIEDNIIENQIASDVRKLIDLLPEDQKQVILLRHYGDFSFKEIADQTGVSINTALGRMRYALINLRKLIEEKKLNLTKI